MTVMRYTVPTASELAAALRAARCEPSPTLSRAAALARVVRIDEAALLAGLHATFGLAALRTAEGDMVPIRWSASEPFDWAAWVAEHPGTFPPLTGGFGHLIRTRDGLKDFEDPEWLLECLRSEREARKADVEALQAVLDLALRNLAAAKRPAMPLLPEYLAQVPSSVADLKRLERMQRERPDLLDPPQTKPHRRKGAS